ncbi:MAG: ATP-binding protein [Turicibacter sp.]|nr:ATP-binding protein [Turicibacter sp.]
MSTTQKKALPIGVEFFDKMIENDYYYVDKTLLIKDIIDKKGEVNLFTRPRRFGKSLNISMLQCFFDNLMIDKASIFDGLNISETGEAYLKHQNQYPVIKLGFKDVEASDFEGAMEMFAFELSTEFDRHRYLLNSDELDDEEKTLYRSILARKVEFSEYRNSLRFLSMCLKKHHAQKVIILIDEYDVPLEKAHFEGYYPEMVKFIRSFFSTALKTNKNLHFALLTGCLRVSRESIFTGLNNLNIVSITSDSFGEYFGFTGPEVEEMLDYYDLKNRANEMRDWYNGYLFGQTVVYNPWSSIKYLYDVIYGKKETPDAHWSNTSSNAIIRDLISISDNTVKEEIEGLMVGGTITKPIIEDIVYADIKKNMDNLWSFLFFTGYLKKISKMQIGVENHLELGIPNKEILYIYNRHIREWFDERVKATDLTPMYKAILNGDTKTFQYELTEMLQNTISYFDSKEEFYHGFLAAVTSTMAGYTTKSNRESGNGRGDIFIRPSSIRKPAVIIEVKVADVAKDLTKKCDEALKQIEEKKYDDELLREGYTDVIKYGIAFYRKDCEIKIYE